MYCFSKTSLQNLNFLDEESRKNIAFFHYSYGGYQIIVSCGTDCLKFMVI